jgi:hypothetical protein
VRSNGAPHHFLSFRLEVTAPMPAAAPHRWRRSAVRAMLGAVATAWLLAGTAVLVARGWQDDLPDRVASHWDGQGVPDDTMSLGTFVLVDVVLVLALTLMFAGIGVAAGREASTRRTLAGVVVWSGGLGATLLLVTLGVQRGLTDPAQAELPGWLLAAVLLVPLLPAVVVAVLVPADPPRPTTTPVPADAPRAELPHGTGTVWETRIGPGRGALVVAAGAAASVVVVAVAVGSWWLLVVAAALVALFAATLAFTVRVDASGLRVRSSLGRPQTLVPADEIVRADVVHVNPLGDFGGWGWRVGIDDGRVGVVLRTGDALLVERTGGRKLVVTLDDAAHAAALLNSVADRARP